MNALALSLDTLTAVKVASNSIVFFGDDNKPLYIFESSASGSAYVSNPISNESLEAIQQWSQLMIANTSLDSVFRLLTSSLTNDADQLRGFLAAWNGLEIFINKVFSKYEQGLFQDLKGGKPQGSWLQYLDRIKDVMKDKYRLTDRFALVVFRLSPDDADGDYREFSEAKKLRDNLFHGQDVNEGDLPTKSVQALLRKYVRLHFENERKTPN